MSRMTEDPEFEFGGYARCKVAELIEGDGVRWPEGDGCWLVTKFEMIGRLVALTLVDRSSWVESELGTGTPESQMLATMQHVKVMDTLDPVWVRL